MKTRYLIRPKMQADECLYSFVERCAAANYISAERLSRRLGVDYPHLLKPRNNHLINKTLLTDQLASLFSVNRDMVMTKFVALAVNHSETGFLWQGLYVPQQLLRASPLVCPICRIENPSIIRCQWYLDCYRICGKHLATMQCSQPTQIQLPLTTHSMQSPDIYTAIDDLTTCKFGSEGARAEIQIFIGNHTPHYPTIIKGEDQATTTPKNSYQQIKLI